MEDEHKARLIAKVHSK